MKYVGVALLLVIACLAGWAFLEPRLLDVEHESARIPGLPEAWDGRRIAVMSDWQIGLWGDNESTIRDAVERTVQEKPALVLLLGDFVYHAGEGPKADPEIRTATALVEPLTRAGLPVYAVFGNHDYATTGPGAAANETLAARLEWHLERVGVDVLRNEAVPIPSRMGDPDQPDTLYLIGIGSRWAGKARPDAALQAVPEGAPRIVMMHHPDSFETLPPHTAPLAVAGHTHGGQIRIPFTPEWSWLTYAKDDRVHADGWIADYGEPGNHLYVNRGLGMSRAPIRLNCMPELTFITLGR